MHSAELVGMSRLPGGRGDTDGYGCLGTERATRVGFAGGRCDYRAAVAAGDVDGQPFVRRA